MEGSRPKGQTEARQVKEDGPGGPPGPIGPGPAQVGRGTGTQPPPLPNETLSVIYTNARSINSKLVDLETLISDNNPDIILLTETWCNSDITNSYLNLNGYFIDPDLRVDRLDTANGIGGGLLVYCKNGLNIIPVEKTIDYNQYCQFLVKSDQCNNDLCITLVYRSPNSTKENNDLLCKIVEESVPNTIIIGDFNFPQIDWSDGTGDSKSRNLINVADNKFLTQIVNFPTHQRGNILDIALTDIPDKILNVENIGNLGSSDHCLIQIDVMFNCNFIKTSELSLDWKNAKEEDLRNFFSNIDWNLSMSNMDTDQAWQFFTKKIEEGTKQFIPTVPRRSKNNPCWITPKVKKLSRKKQKMWKKYMNNRCEATFNDYKKIEKDLKRTVRNSKRKYEKKIAKSTNKKKFNSYVKSKVSNRVPIGPLKVGNKVITDAAEAAEILNKTFCDVFTIEDTSYIPVMQDLNCTNWVNNIHFCKDKISKKIEKLEDSSSPGPDGISARILKKFGPLLSIPLATIYNKSMQEGTVPDDWRCANVTPIFKKGKKADPGNYRPVSLTSIPCKLMESLIKDTIMDHLIDNELILSSQHGFMSRKSTVTNLLDFFEYVTKEVDNGNPVDAIYLDFSKAFDRVPFERLLSKLKSHNVGGNVHKWISNWLHNRKQRVVINGQSSGWEEVLSGVPQGSVLGPLCFIVFINDLDLSAVNIDAINKFADDTKVGHVVKDNVDQLSLQTCLNELSKWAARWGMKFNETKCKVIHFGHNNKKHKYSMNSIQLPEVSEETDVGVLVHQSLKPSKHCLNISRKANGVLGTISRSFHYRDRHVFLNLYKTHVRCLLEYCSPAWSPSSQGDIDLLENVQRRAVAMVSGLKSSTYEDKLRELKLDSLEHRRERSDMVQTYKVIHGLDRVDHSKWFNLVEASENGRVTRQSACPKNICPTRSRLDIRSNFYSSRVINKWNSLPSEVKLAPNLNLFKARYDKL